MAPDHDAVGQAERLLRGRRSSRRFLPDPVPDSLIRTVFDLASTAPSASNTQPWSVEVVSGPVRDKVSAALLAAEADRSAVADFPYDPAVYSEAQNLRRRQTGALIYDAAGIARSDAEGRYAQYLDNLRFFGAPHVALVFTPMDPSPLILNDIGMYTQTLLLAMTAHGIASCTQALIAMGANAVRQTLGITDRKLLYGVAFGYPDPDDPINQVRTPRAPLEDIVHFH